MRIARILMSLFFVVGLSACGQSALDKCFDSKSYLWSPEATGNQYKGNQAYWDAITTCEDEHG